MKNASFQKEKQFVRDYYAQFDAATKAEMHSVQEQYVADDYLWRGFHPFHEIRCAKEVADQFWSPLKTALSSMQRRMDVFMAGQNTIEGQGGVWVVSMGHLMGLFDKPWLGIPPTGKIAMLRYCEFHRVENGEISETAMYFDIPHLMMQAGLEPFPPQTAAHLVQPGPMTHDGLMFDAQDPEEGRKTLDIIQQMIRDLGQWDSELSLEDELRQTWSEGMIWWGPAGIGATYTIERYAKQHSGPFRAGLTDRTRTQHIARLAEGSFGGFFGWPNFMATPTGGFMGMPATQTPAEFRVIDIYRRDGDKLAENWIFIDLLHFWNMQGIDILARTTNIAAGHETGARGATP
ncbi:ester cyclase [Aliiroseovarius sp. F20344]|uniref:nuclear transport factor 2 family protein n=1 Tax=Aliiroseovarius sp. F20344 TaxID=2926414 RepID=UPI001FF41C1E|nr:ester cyclase [Aliiroseovarius sp. F20344]MCK0141054.1 ester cyclase [Aliiroseovarius sp. F20344]